MHPDLTFREFLGDRVQPSRDLDETSVDIPKSLKRWLRQAKKETTERSELQEVSQRNAATLSVNYTANHISTFYPMEQIRELPGQVNELEMRGMGNMATRALETPIDTSWESKLLSTQPVSLMPVSERTVFDLCGFLSTSQSVVIRYMMGFAFKHWTEGVYAGVEFEPMQIDITRYAERLDQEIRTRLQFAQEL